MSSYIAISLAIFSTIIGSFGSLYLKKASGELTLNLKNIFTNLTLIKGLFFYGLGFISYVIALKMSELSLIYPILSLAYAWVTFLSYHYLKEKINTFNIVGVGLIIIGVVIIGLGA
jgi:undecaprenyl phosphate-alpha-L-ara4N flippase subunit ArnE